MNTKVRTLQLVVAMAAVVCLAGRAYAQRINPATGLPASGAANPSHINPETGQPAAASNTVVIDPATGLPAGPEASLQKVLNEARDLTSRHQYEEALQHYIQFYNQAQESRESSIRISLITVIPEWMELCRRYPKARQALIEIRDRDTRKLSRGGGGSDLFQTVANINQALPDDDATLALFKTLYEKNPRLAKQCYYHAKGLLVARGEYQLCLDCLGNWQIEFDGFRHAWEQMKKMESRQEQTRQDQIKQSDQFWAELHQKYPQLPPHIHVQTPTPPPFADNSFVGQTCQLIEILIGTGHRPDAEKIRDQAVAVLDDPRLRSAIGDAEERIRTVQAAPAAVATRPTPAAPPPWLNTNLPAPSASVERWLPSPGPGEKVDLKTILAEAKAFTSAGQYEDALQRYLWFHNHAQEFGDPYQNNVRVTSAISDWGELGRHYPKAQQALMEIRDAKTREIAEGRGYWELFVDVQAINHVLQNDDATYALFKLIREQDSKLAGQCCPFVQDLLVAKGEYQWCFSCLGSPQATFDFIRQFYERQIFNQKRMAEKRQEMAPKMAEIRKQRGLTNSWSPPDLSASAKKYAEDRFVEQTRQLIEILVGAGHQTDAENIRDQAVAVLDDPRLKSAVSDAEKKIRKPAAPAGNP